MSDIDKERMLCVIEKLGWCSHDDADSNNDHSASQKQGTLDLKRSNKGVPIFSVDVQPLQNDGVERFATGTNEQISRCQSNN